MTDGNELLLSIKAVDELSRRMTFVGSGTVSWNPGDLGDGAGETSAGITVTGAALGDFVLVACPEDAIDVLFCGYVQAANTVEIRIQNEATANRNLGAGTWKVLVFRFT